jgi:hypothetical protein
LALSDAEFKAVTWVNLNVETKAREFKVNEAHCHAHIRSPCYLFNMGAL